MPVPYKKNIVKIQSLVKAGHIYLYDHESHALASVRVTQDALADVTEMGITTIDNPGGDPIVSRESLRKATGGYAGENDALEGITTAPMDDLNVPQEAAGRGPGVFLMKLFGERKGGGSGSRNSHGNKSI